MKWQLSRSKWIQINEMNISRWVTIDGKNFENGSNLDMYMSDVLVLISVNLEFRITYQNLSHFLSLWNCIPMMHPNVGPISPPCKGVSLIPPENKSISSTLLNYQFKI